MELCREPARAEGRVRPRMFARARQDTRVQNAKVSRTAPENYFSDLQYLVPL